MSKRNALISALAGAVLSVAMVPAGAADIELHAYAQFSKAEPMQVAQQMDRNRDGRLSKQEYTDFHAKAWEQMEGQPAGENRTHETPFLGLY